MAKEGFKSGFVAVLGRPNVGKSTLINALLDSKISIVSTAPQTTRHQIRGILNLKDAQIVFVDTPGIHSFRDRLATHLNTIAKKSLEGCDLILYVVDVSRRVGQEEAQIMDILASQKVKIIMAMNKMDLGVGYLNAYVDFWKAKLKEKKRRKDPLVYFLPLSAKTKKNTNELKNALVENLPSEHPFYDTQTLTDFPIKFRVADIVREKLYGFLTKELPHSIAVEVEEIEERKTLKKEALIYIKVNIYINRTSQKMIVIGKGGHVLKEVGRASRLDIEEIYKKKVFLEIKVKVLKDWQEKPRILKELGYWWA
ncbi:MAG: GTPase Era [Candidatus Omnitrophota bacterium]|nr:MAG: GTPase Era [Candidatus Omnitrophota bacterium]